MRNSRLSLIIACLALLISGYSIYKSRVSQNVLASPSQSRVDRILESGELKVGYFVVPPMLTKKSGSGELSGPIYEFVNRLGDLLSVKVNWVEEANLTNLSVALNSNRYDMIAFPLWESADRGKKVDFSVPIFYSPVAAYVKMGDRRFDSNLQLANSSTIKIAAIDGELAGVIAKNEFPNAQIVSKPQLVDYSQLLLDVASGKADLTFFNEVFGNRYIKKNPGSVRKVPTTRPIRLYAETFALPENDYRFKQMIDAALNEMINNGLLEEMMRRHALKPEEYFLPALPYRAVR